MTLSNLLCTLGSQQAAAERIGVAQTTISAWRRGRAYPRRLALRALASALNLPEAEVESIVAADRAARMVQSSSMASPPCLDHAEPVVGAAQ